MPTPSKIDVRLDEASLIRVDLHGDVEEAQRLVNGLLNQARDLWDTLERIGNALAGPGDHAGPGPLAELLTKLREEPALRRAREEVRS